MVILKLRTVVAAALVLCAVLVLAASAFGSSLEATGVFPAGDGLEVPESMAVDQSSGDVLVLDDGHEAIEKFDAAGNPVAFGATGSYISGNRLTGTPTGGLELDSNEPSASEVAVDNAAGPFQGDIFVAAEDAYAVDVFAGDGSYLGTLQGAGGPESLHPCGVAVDGSGRVYAANAQGAIVRYTPTGLATGSAPVGNGDFEISEITVAPEPCSIAADSAGDVFELKWPAGPLNEFAASQFPASGSAAGEPREVAAGGKAVAVDAADGRVYDDEGGQVSVFETSHSEPELVEVFASGLLSGASDGVAVADTGGTPTVYVVDQGTEQTVGPPSVYVFGVPTPAAPEILEEFVSNVNAESADLQGRVDPAFTATSYRFEYGPTNTYGASAPAVEQGVGETGGPFGGQSAGPVHLTGLQPGITYHYRLAATNAHGTTFGADATFTTQPPGSEFELPDGRAYELVSPPDKNGSQIGQGLNTPAEGGAIVQASEDGAAIAYMANGPVGSDQIGDVNGTQVYSTRSATGWSSRDIVTPRSKGDNGVLLGHGEEYQLFSSDLSAGLVEPDSKAQLSVEAPPGERNLYRWNADENSYTPLITSPPNEPFTFLSHSLRIAGASPDLSHIVFESHQALTPGALNAEEEANLYEWADGKLQLINILPATEGGEATAGNAILGGGSLSNTRSAISADGSHVIWTDEQSNNIYVRDTVTEQTALVGTGVYQTASSDGSRIYFSDSTASDDLYEYDTETGEQTDVTPGNAEVQGILGTSTDGKYVYFVATGALASGARPGADNLYLAREDGTSWAPPRFIATLAPRDGADWGLAVGVSPSFGPILASLTAQVSPDGRFVAFMSSARLTGYDNRDAVSGEPDVEVYLYDSAEPGRLVCASCNPSGGRPVGELDNGKLPMDAWAQKVEGVDWDGQWLAAAIRGWTAVANDQVALYQSRYLFDSGRLFFDSSDALVSQDTNSREDVYEYEPVGVGDCGSLSSTFHQGKGGCVSLISAGLGSADSVFMDASATGDDAFFITRDRLVPQDFDDSYDMYDAHVCSVTAPCLPVAAVSPPPCATGDACKPAPSPQPAIFGNPASATFTGIGNVNQAARTGVSGKKTKKRKKARRRLRRRHGVGAGRGSRGAGMRGHKR